MADSCVLAPSSRLRAVTLPVVVRFFVLCAAAGRVIFLLTKRSCLGVSSQVGQTGTFVSLCARRKGQGFHVLVR